MAAAKVLGGVLLKQQAESGPSVSALASELVAENREAALTTGPAGNVGAGLKLLDAAQAGDVGFAQQLLRVGAAPDQEEHGFTPLILAAREGKLDVLILLLERGADPSHRFQGRTPLQHALARERKGAARAAVR